MSSASNSPVSIFLAATSAILATTALPAVSQESGGLKEWTTDQAVDEKSVLDSDAQEFMKKAEQEEICVPIGEGENCW